MRQLATTPDRSWASSLSSSISYSSMTCGDHSGRGAITFSACPDSLLHLQEGASIRVSARPCRSFNAGTPWTPAHLTQFARPNSANSLWGWTRLGPPFYYHGRPRWPIPGTWSPAPSGNGADRSVPRRRRLQAPARRCGRGAESRPDGVGPQRRFGMCSRGRPTAKGKSRTVGKEP